MICYSMISENQWMDDRPVINQERGPISSEIGNRTGMQTVDSRLCVSW